MRPLTYAELEKKHLGIGVGIRIPTVFAGTRSNENSNTEKGMAYRKRKREQIWAELRGEKYSRVVDTERGGE